MTDVVIGVGTNLGDRLAHLRRGVRALRTLAPLFRQRALSPIYESDALVPEGADPAWLKPYLNLAVRGEWIGSPAVLLTALKDLERLEGRAPAARWAPRELDLDLLVFGPQAAEGEGFVVPHAGLPERPFALLPLADVWPDWRFPAGPLAGRSASELAEPWRAEPAHVPLRTTRTALSLTEIVAAVNITPDSFSEGGRFVDPARAADHALRMVDEGADVIDIGAESTRPGGAPVDQAEEWRRLGPVLERLTKRIDRSVSVDTRHAGTARRAIDAGARWINDVTGLTAADMVAVARGSGVDLVVMHSLTIPPSRDATLPPDRNPVAELRRWGTERLAVLEKHGIAPTRIILDPGIGFGKTAGQSTALVRDADLFCGLGVRTLVGHSRKSFLASWFPADHPAARDPMARELETALLASHCSLLGVDYVRVHDVAGAHRALRAAALVGPSILRAF